MSRHHKATPSREWERIRQRAMLRDGHRCTNCGKPGRLEVHHIAPVSGGRDECAGEPAHAVQGLPYKVSRG